MNRFFVSCFFFSLLVSCASPKADNPCDLEDSIFLPNIFYRLITKDKSNQCGYNLSIKLPACDLSYEETHLAENWPQVKAEMESQFALGSDGTEDLFQYRSETIGSITGNSSTAFQGALNAPNGEIYFLPYASEMFLSINPVTKAYTNVGSKSSYVEFIGGSLGPSGKIYLSPHQLNDFQSIDTTNNNAKATMGNPSMSATAYNGAMYAPNGKIYFVPSSETIIRYYDTNKASIGSVTTPTGSGYSSAVLTPQGKIYFIPFLATSMAILDTKDDSVSFHPYVFPGSGAYIAGVLTPNGRIYFIPYNAHPVIYLNPTTNQIDIAAYLPAPTTNMFNGAVLAPNGKIYPVPSDNATDFISIDTKDNTITTLFPKTTAGDSYRGGALGPDGNIYLAPHGANRFDLIQTKSKGRFCNSLRLSPYWNKL
ncbi:hypothetical protein EHQ68_01870 [Leptospira congkakensis]|uniref:Lipoprotein n=2 Tax=Leptospira congkakensis TaxID=2484932 RepID=A0A4Z1ACB2_9LEPT|nr:hypothetical protein EHQ69_09635 [Leptospira congkakensis]TGL91211.1 hypothetical protein EHQ68_01870 [Leptospira congkakensis]TGL98263.1 hypothetical protein EHQ70_01460 [Leptospira congkakensis]